MARLISDVMRTTLPLPFPSLSPGLVRSLFSERAAFPADLGHHY
jgi:hypothetical protein